MHHIDLSGMTVNERLFAMSLLDEYTRAKEAKHEARVRELLELVQVDQPSIELTVANMVAGITPKAELKKRR